jgi:hypothetical protein
VRATWHQPKHMTCAGIIGVQRKCGPANAWFNSKLGSRILDNRHHRNYRLRENLVDLAQVDTLANDHTTKEKERSR